MIPHMEKMEVYCCSKDHVNRLVVQNLVEKEGLKANIQ